MAAPVGKQTRMSTSKIHNVGLCKRQWIIKLESPRHEPISDPVKGKVSKRGCPHMAQDLIEHGLFEALWQFGHDQHVHQMLEKDANAMSHEKDTLLTCKHTLVNGQPNVGRNDIFMHQCRGCKHRDGGQQKRHGFGVLDAFGERTFHQDAHRSKGERQPGGLEQLMPAVRPQLVQGAGQDRVDHERSPLLGGIRAALHTETVEQMQAVAHAVEGGVQEDVDTCEKDEKHSGLLDPHVVYLLARE